MLSTPIGSVYFAASATPVGSLLIRLFLLEAARAEPWPHQSGVPQSAAIRRKPQHSVAMRRWELCCGESSAWPGSRFAVLTTVSSAWPSPGYAGTRDLGGTAPLPGLRRPQAARNDRHPHAALRR